MHADCKCVYYAGSVAERTALRRDHVETITFNCLVTTYEFVMRDATHLSKVPWKYLIIDEAQRMKDRDSKLAKAFDRFVFEKRLLLTGTPLQNELRELWSLLNLLLPELFNDKAQFARWFADALAKSQEKGSGQEDELINNEKRVVVVNRWGPKCLRWMAQGGEAC
jgi:SWI/SNF-related matrix-associated actin-dependent regulator of chromatin subfamily A member 2/4